MKGDAREIYLQQTYKEERVRVKTTKERKRERERERERERING